MAALSELSEDHQLQEVDFVFIYFSHLWTAQRSLQLQAYMSGSSGRPSSDVAKWFLCLMFLFFWVCSLCDFSKISFLGGHNEFIFDGEDVKQCINLDANINCKKYLAEQVKCLDDKNTLSHLHLNVWSLRKHHDELVALLSTVSCSFEVIGRTETWLSDKLCTDILNLDGYKLVNRNRASGTGGFIFVEITASNDEKSVVRVIYWPPDADFAVFSPKLEESLYFFNNKNKNGFLLGDYNVDLSKGDTAKNDFMNAPHY